MEKWKTVSKTYVVHIYRYDRDDPSNIIGTVEDVEESAKRPFSGADELYRLMRPAEDGKSRRDTKNKGFMRVNKNEKRLS